MSDAPAAAIAPRRRPWLWRLPLAIGATLAVIAFGELSARGFPLAGMISLMASVCLPGFGVLLELDEARATGTDARAIGPLAVTLIAMGAIAGWWCADIRMKANFGGLHCEALAMLVFFFPCLLLGLAYGGGSAPAALWPMLAHGLSLTVVYATTDFARRGQWFDDLYLTLAPTSLGFACAAAVVHALLRRRGLGQFRAWTLLPAAGAWIAVLGMLDWLFRIGFGWRR